MDEERKANVIVAPRPARIPQAIKPIHSLREYHAGPFARWHRGDLGPPHPGRECGAFDIDLVDWLFREGKPEWPLALWEETRLGSQYENLKRLEFTGLRILANHLCVPAFLVETDEEATRFVLRGLTETFTREWGREEMAAFIEDLRRWKAGPR